MSTLHRRVLRLPRLGREDRVRRAAVHLLRPSRGRRGRPIPVRVDRPRLRDGDRAVPGGRDLHRDALPGPARRDELVPDGLGPGDPRQAARAAAGAGGGAAQRLGPRPGPGQSLDSRKIRSPRPIEASSHPQAGTTQLNPGPTPPPQLTLAARCIPRFESGPLNQPVRFAGPALSVCALSPRNARKSGPLPRVSKPKTSPETLPAGDRGAQCGARLPRPFRQSEFSAGRTYAVGGRGRRCESRATPLLPSQSGARC